MTQQNHQKRKWSDGPNVKGKRYKLYTRNQEKAENKEGKTEKYDDSIPKEERKPKRKCAVLLGFCGSNYQGMQYNEGVKTIEGDVFNALVKAGAISKLNSDNMSKVGFMRAARTDKGVHAAVNLISLKINPDIIKKVNEFLPPQIRVWGYVRTINSFDAKNLCDSRVYEYFLPTFVFLPPKPTMCMASMLSRLRGEIPDFVNDDPDKDFHEQEGVKVRTYRISKSKMTAVREAFKTYIGTHNFHNYTVRKSFSDRNCNRFIKDIKVEDPKVIGDIEWISIKIHGQSFMLHQIRKMIGMVVLVIRALTPAQKIIPETFGPHRIHVPKSPGFGLLLEKPIYDSYNTKTAKENSRDPIETNLYKADIEAFKEKFIYSCIFEQEKENHLFSTWLGYIDSLPGPDFEYLGPKGIIPESAIIKDDSKSQDATNPTNMINSDEENDNEE